MYIVGEDIFKRIKLPEVLEINETLLIIYDYS
jgi:hypothetical protein